MKKKKLCILLIALLALVYSVNALQINDTYLNNSQGSIYVNGTLEITQLSIGANLIEFYGLSTPNITLNAVSGNVSLKFYSLSSALIYDSTGMIYVSGDIASNNGDLTFNTIENHTLYLLNNYTDIVTTNRNTTRYLNVTSKKPINLNVTNYKITLSPYEWNYTYANLITLDLYNLSVANGNYTPVITATTNANMTYTYTALPIIFSMPSHITITEATFSNNEGLNTSLATTINASCNNTQANASNMSIIFNGVTLFRGIVNNSIIQQNTTTLNNGLNTLNVTCSDYLETVTAILTRTVYSTGMCLIDEVDNVNFNPNNISGARVYIDDNSSYYDYKTTNSSCVNYTSTQNNKMRFELRYATGTVITRYIDLALTNQSVRVCANKEGITHYEQLIIASSEKAVVMKSLFSNCLIAADYTRFAYQDALLLKAYSSNQLYYLYTLTNGVQTFLASIDGTIATYVNLDTLEFKQQTYDINLIPDTLTFRSAGANTTEISYRNTRADNLNLTVTITNLNDGSVVFSTSSFTNPNNFDILFDYATLGVNESTVFKIEVAGSKADGTTDRIIKYFNTLGQSGFLKAGLAFAISFLLIFFGLTLASTKITFSWFGIFVEIAAITILAFALNTWYTNFLMVIEIIILLFTVILTIFSGSKTITGAA